MEPTPPDELAALRDRVGARKQHGDDARQRADDLADVARLDEHRRRSTDERVLQQLGLQERTTSLRDEIEAASRQGEDDDGDL